jgi:hypothetical protein
MDSIERMRRINDLTRELKQHGFAESSFEAIQQANQIYGSDSVEDNVKHGMIQKSAHERMIKDDNMGDDSVPYSERKIAKISENVDVLTTKMNEIVRAINDLDARLTDLKSKQEKIVLSRPAVVESKVEHRAEVSIEAQPARSESAPVAKEEHSSHAQPRKDEYDLNQRTGNFQSQDVAIDKMFYFGNKK